MKSQKLFESKNKSLCVMQPYFFPYEGYFELFKSVNHFVIFDNAQMKKNSWVHRNIFVEDNLNRQSWITIPLKKFHQKQKINEIELAEDYQVKLEVRFSKFKSLRSKIKDHAILEDLIFKPESNSLVDYLNNQLKYISFFFNKDIKFYYASEILNRDLFDNYQDYIINITKSLECNTYVNLSGGAELYSNIKFYENNIKLIILKNKNFNKISFLHYLLSKNFQLLK